MLGTSEVDEYVRELKSTFLRHHVHSGYAIVIDITACPIQQQDTLQAFVIHMAAMPKARAIAIVTGSSLARMQVRRVFTQPYARVVATVPEARAWVLSGLEPASEPPARAAAS